METVLIIWMEVSELGEWEQRPAAHNVVIGWIRATEDICSGFCFCCQISVVVHDDSDRFHIMFPHPATFTRIHRVISDAQHHSRWYIVFPLSPRACMCWHVLHQLQHRWPLHGYNKIVSNWNKLLLRARTVVATFEKLHVLLKEYILGKYTFLFSHWALDNKLTRPITLTSVG